MNGCRLPTVAQDLASIPALRDVAALDLIAAAPCWTQRALESGHPLWTEGERADGLAMLVSGEMIAERQGKELGRVLSGEVLGEASAFLREHSRTVTLRAAVPCRVLLISAAKLDTLRGLGSGVYDALVDLAHHALVRRIHAANLRIARSSTGSEAAPARAERSALVRLWNTLRPGLPSGPCPTLESLLPNLPGLHAADDATIAAIAKGFTAEAVGAGTILFLEGEPGTSAWLLASGRVDVLRNVRGGQAERLATLDAGSLLGVNALIERDARTASCIAATPCWLYRMDGRAGYKHLRGLQRQAWRETLLGALTLQMRSADHSLDNQGVSPSETTEPEVHGAKRPKSADRFTELLRASGWTDELDGLDLSDVETIVTEDDRRSRVRRPASV